MTARSSWGKTPRESVEEECARRGKDEVVAGCIRLLYGGDADAADAEMILALGGPPASWVVTGQPAGPDYWLRVWATRGLLWCWDDVAFVPVKDSLSDDAWRVREMALRVIARHRLVDTVSRVADLQHDPSERVRTAAARAVKRLAAAET